MEKKPEVKEVGDYEAEKKLKVWNGIIDSIGMKKNLFLLDGIELTIPSISLVFPKSKAVIHSYDKEFHFPTFFIERLPTP